MSKRNKTDFDDDLLNVKLTINQMRRRCEQHFKPTSCPLCGKAFDQSNSICDSHSVPRFVLENIATLNLKGQRTVVIASSLWQSHIPDYALPSFLSPHIGANHAGVFKSICRNCDKVFFKDYEEEESLLKLKPSTVLGNRILAEIMIKAHLAKISKLSHDWAMLDATIAIGADEDDTVLAQGSRKRIQLTYLDSMYEIEQCKAIIENASSNGFLVPIFLTLPYRNQVAMQIVTPISRDLRGKKMTDEANFSENYHPPFFCICSFPLKDRTVFLMFCLASSKDVYGEFVEEIESLSVANKLKVLQASSFTAVDEIYLTHSIAKKMLKDANFMRLINFNNPHCPEQTNLNQYRETTNLSNYHRQSNFLAHEFKV